MGARKIDEFEQKKEVNDRFAVSNPATPTLKNGINALIISKLERYGNTSTDKKKTNALLYKEPAIYDADGDVNKQWFVFYSFRNPKTFKFERFKVFTGINTSKLKSERYEVAKAVSRALSELLQEGFNPFEEYKPGGDFTISSCIDTFLTAIEPDLRPKSYSRYFYEFRIFKQWLEDNGLDKKHISKIKKAHVFSFLEYCRVKSKWTSGKTYNTHKGNLSRFFNYFINNYDDVIEVNPVSKIESKPVVVKGNIPYNDHEFKAVRDCILEHDPYLWRICQLVYYAAVRNEQEGLNLRIKDVDFASKQIIIGADVTKGKERQMIPIYPEFLEILKTWQLHKYPGHYYIFGRGDKPGTTRIGVNRFSKRFRKIKQKIGLGENYGIYSFKHTRGCHMVDDGASLYEIQTLFRHKDLQATMKYLRSIGRVIGKKELTKSRIV